MVLDRPSGPARLRLRVREVECPQPGVEGGPEGSGTELTERVIFTDVVPL